MAELDSQNKRAAFLQERSQIAPRPAKKAAVAAETAAKAPAPEAVAHTGSARSGHKGRIVAGEDGWNTVA